MLLRLTIDAALFLVGVWLLFYAERLQKYVTLYHERRKRTHLASRFFIKATALDYELVLRVLGGLLAAAAILLLVQLFHDPQYWR